MVNWMTQHATCKQVYAGASSKCPGATLMGVIHPSQLRPSLLLPPRFLHRSHAGLGTFPVLVRGAGAAADGTDNLAVDDDGHAAANDAEAAAVRVEDAEGLASGQEGRVRVVVCRRAVTCRGEGLQLDC